MSHTDWLTLALVVITTFYAWATFRILRANEAVVVAMRDQTEALLRPYVVISASARVGTTLLALEIRNTGRSPALSLHMTLDRPFYVNGEKHDEKNIANLSAFTTPIDSFPPDGRLTYTLGVGGAIFGDGMKELCPPVFKVHATYQYGTRMFSEDSVVDMRPMLNSSVQHDAVADEVKTLRESLEKLAAHT